MAKNWKPMAHGAKLCVGEWAISWGCIYAGITETAPWILIKAYFIKYRWNTNIEITVNEQIWTFSVGFYSIQLIMYINNQMTYKHFLSIFVYFILVDVF